MEFCYKNSFLYKKIAAVIHKCSVKRNPENEMRRVYFKTYHRYPNLEKPKNLIEKIYWLQLHTDTSMWTRCADKYAMRDYVSECGYGDYLPKNYGHWKNVNDIDFDSLPDEFVLKTNNGCGTVMIIRDKSTIDLSKTKRKLKQWLSIPYGWAGGQLHYTRIDSCIIAEELLHQEEIREGGPSQSLTDYKVWCFDGKPECILVVYNRIAKVNYTLDMYDINWERIPNSLKNNAHFSGNEDKYPKPGCLHQMLEIASALSKPFPEVRVDFYVINDKPVVGELTFTSGYGNYTDSFYDYLGEKIVLPVDLCK